MGPGSAAHRHSASKTRVNALMALRSIRGTNPHPEEARNVVSKDEATGASHNSDISNRA